MTKYILLAVVFLAWLAGDVKAAVMYGGGYYTNLCDSGTKATHYSCDPGCDPAKGACSSGNGGAVRWQCSGKWDQCLEAEAGWSNYEEMGNPGCGKTVQLALFDKRCRQEDGRWDQTCRLMGYMVWYGGECTAGGVQATPTGVPAATAGPAPSPTSGPTPTRVPTPTREPTPTATPTPVRVCNKTCGQDSDCGAGFTCESRVCRNPTCPSDKQCFCGQVAGAKKTPETGGEGWILAGAVGVLITGFLARKWARKIW